MIIGLANDHSGMLHKNVLLKHLENRGCICVNMGADTERSVDYPEFGHKLALLISEGKANIGFAFCGTGNGIAMTLNRHPQIRAGIAWNVQIAQLIRQHNNANVCVIPARFVSAAETPAIADAFIAAEFDSGRHQQRVEMIELF